MSSDSWTQKKYVAERWHGVACGNEDTSSGWKFGGKRSTVEEKKQDMFRRQLDEEKYLEEEVCGNIGMTQ